jgi:hypothetical protein
MNPADHILRPRRQFLWEMGAGFAGLALTSLLDGGGFFSSRASAAELAANPLLPKPPHLPTKAKSVIFLFMFGGPSQLDLFDYKPELQKRARSSNMASRACGAPTPSRTSHSTWTNSPS